MSSHPAPEVEVEQIRAALQVADLSAAIDFYTTRLGFQHAFSWGEPATFAGVTLGGAEVFLRVGTPAPQGCSLFFTVGDADELFEFHRSNGVEVIEALGDRPWELRDYTIRDLDGYALTFGHYIPAHEPPLEIERVDVPVRLERRLAAVLADLAELKGMSVSSCIEETLLHTFEPLGNGVASPHTKAHLRRIEELKRKHGLDYDCHASYRFVEGTDRSP